MTTRSMFSLACAILLVACSSAAPAQSGPSAPPTASAAALSPVPATAAVTSPSPVQTPAPTPIPLFGPVPTGPLDAATTTRLDAAIEKFVSGGAPDAIGAVITADGTWAGAAGIDGSNGRKALPTDEFGIASVSKTFVGALVMRLVADGKMDLDAPLQGYLQGIDADANGATVRQTLEMRSGLGDTIDSYFQTNYAHCDKVWTRDELLKTFGPRAGDPGTYWYSNPSYKLLGWAAERASGKPLATALTDLVIRPAGTDRILLQGAGRATPKPWALPIGSGAGPIKLADYGTGGALPCLATATGSLGGAAMASDAPSLARWGWSLFAGTVLDKETLRTMTTLADGGHGLGIDRINEFGVHLALGHSGSQPGYAAVLAVLPERQISIVVFVNNEQSDVVQYAVQLLKAIGG